jgi:hypothetical protein
MQRDYLIHEEENPPYPPLKKGEFWAGQGKSPFLKGGFRGDYQAVKSILAPFRKLTVTLKYIPLRSFEFSPSPPTFGGRGLG